MAKLLIEYYENSYLIIESSNAGIGNDETEYSKLIKTSVGRKQGGSLLKRSIQQQVHIYYIKQTKIFAMLIYD